MREFNAVNGFSAAAAPRTHDASQRNRETIERLVDPFARNAIKDIMACFAEDAVYQDVRGGPPGGTTFRGKDTIEQMFSDQIRLLGQHTYENPIILADDDSGFARWSLVLGRREDRNAPRYDGVDHFLFDKEGLCISKTAWLKAQPSIANRLFTRRPFASLRARLMG